jgi:hypothetical protein
VLAVPSVLVAAIFVAYHGIRVNTWAVMTDELQVARLATSIAESLSPVPTIRGTYYGAHAQLYPLLLAPLYGTLSPPVAATAAHVLNVGLLVSAAIPAWLIARAVSGSDTAGYVAGALTAGTPWLALSSTLLTENVAYAAFTWSVYFCLRAIAHPSRTRDAVALAGLALAFFARTQLFVLALALPLAVVLHEVGNALRERRPSPVRSGASRAVASHRVLTAACLAGAVVATLLAASGALAALVGNYAVTFEGDLVSSDIWRAAGEHFDQLALGVGVLPAVLWLSFVVTTAIHGGRRDAHAFAALSFVLCPLLIFQVTSFDLRFTPGQFIQDRYLVYVVPLFAVGCAAWLSQRRHLTTRLVGAAGAGAVVVALLSVAPDERRVIFWAAPAGAFRPTLADAAGWAHLPEVAFLQLAAGLAVLLVLALAWRAPRIVLVVTSAALFVFGAVQAVVVMERYVEPSTVRPLDGRRDWIDAAVPSGASVALVPGGVDGPAAWWEAEFWNRSVDRSLRVDGGTTFTPFPVVETSIDRTSGRFVGRQQSDYLVVAAGETRFGLAASRTEAVKPPLELVRVRRPYRLAWTTEGLTHDGWMLPGEPVTVRVYGVGAEEERRAVELTLASSRHAPRRFDVAVTAAGVTERWSVDPGGARPPVSVTVCIPARGHVDVHLLARGRARLPHGRTVSLHLERLTVSRPWPCTIT